MLPLLWRKCSTKCCHQTLGAPWPQIQNSELACRIPVASGAKAVLPRYPNLCYCFGYFLGYTTHSDCILRPSSAEACDIRAGDNLRSLSNNVLLGHVANRLNSCDGRLRIPSAFRRPCRFLPEEALKHLELKFQRITTLLTHSLYWSSSSVA